MHEGLRSPDHMLEILLRTEVLLNGSAIIKRAFIPSAADKPRLMPSDADSRRSPLIGARQESADSRR
jgi:hypothetical protein